MGFSGGNTTQCQQCQELYRLLGIKLAATTAYHPQGNGQTEQVNQELEQYLCLFTNQRQGDWVGLLPFAEFQYNNQVHSFCHGPCSVTFFLKNNQRTAPTESPMMAALPLFSATVTTSHLRRTYIGAPSEYSSTPLPPKQPAFLSLSLPTNTMCLSRGHHKDLRGFTSASFGTIWNTSLLVICSFYYHMLFTITPYMFMFCLYINTPVCCMYFASLNINLATYFS